MFIYKAKERLFYFSLHILAEWRVEPYYLSRSVSLPSLAGLGVFGVLDVLVVSACPEGLVVIALNLFLDLLRDPVFPRGSTDSQ